MSTRKSPRSKKIRVVTYNVLCEALAGADHFPGCDPANLDGDTRFARICATLEDEIANNSIICLQEVGQGWYGRLHAFFAQRNYHFCCRLYGNNWNDYMGVGIATPLKSFDVIDVKSIRVGDRVRLPRAPKPGMIMKFLKSIWTPLWAFIFGWLLYFKLTKWPFEIWSEAKKRFNVAVALEVQQKTTGKSFIISTYHMPCRFMHPDFMVLHSSLALKWVQELGGAKNLPYLLLGDFNWKPQDGAYQLYASGTLEETHPHFPKPLPGITYELNVSPVRSAYAEAFGEEPEFTNNALVKGMNEPFVETLDYIWMSDEWTCHEAKQLIGKAAALESGPYPSAQEPSDHVLLWAYLMLE